MFSMTYKGWKARFFKDFQGCKRNNWQEKKRFSLYKYCYYEIEEFL